MPSIVTLSASVVRHESTTWSPAEIEVGVAVICAVGAGAVAAGAVSIGGGAGFSFFLHPDIAVRDATSKTGTSKREKYFKVHLLLKN
jgi:hypothetical protein